MIKVIRHTIYFFSSLEKTTKNDFFSEQFSYGVFEGYTHFPLSFNFRDIDFGCTMATAAVLAVAVVMVAATTMMRKKSVRTDQKFNLDGKSRSYQNRTKHNPRKSNRRGGRKKAIQEQLSF